MESPILNSIIQTANSHLPPPPIFLFHFPSLPREKTSIVLHVPHPKSHAALLRFPTFAPIRASPASSPPLNCRGWDDDSQQLTGGGNWEVNSGESSSSFQLRDFVASIGINDKKYAFTFLLGTIFAFAIVRVRVSYIALVPASAVVFAVGFSFGFVRSGSGLSLFTVKRKANEASSRGYSDRVNAVVAEFLNEFGVRVSDLKNSLRRAIDSREIKMDELERFVHVIEAMETSALNTRRSVEPGVDSMEKENPKPGGRKRRQIGEVGSQLVQSLLSRMFEPKKKVVSSPKLNKVKEKDNVEQVATVSVSSDSNLEVEEGFNKDVVDSTVSSGSVSSQGSPSRLALDWDGDRRIRIVSDDMQEHVETQASSGQGQSFLDSNGAYSSYSRKTNDGETYSSSSYIDDSRRSNEDLHLIDRQDVPWSEMDSSPSSSYSSSAISDDVAFNRYLTEANSLLKEAKECIRGRQEEEHAEVLLYKSAKLLSKSVALKPMSLLAVGQLGNTYLLHGELKLKISRELRATLSTWGPLSFESQGSISVRPEEVKRKDKLVEVLTNVCDECEELLVEAGRKYRTALSIDGNDMRALYNWGLALTFRAQLIADIGPEAAFDADKLFLAATDKFDAMMSKSNVHAPDALFRWGLVLQQRSRLRPANSKEKAKLLQQAKRLYEDALRMDSDNVQVREALSSCTSELNRRLFRSF